LVKDWETKRDETFAKIRNSILLQNLKGSIPSNKELIHEFVTINPPPKGINVYGQPITSDDQFWIKIPDVELSKNSEVVAWLKRLSVEKEANIWSFCGAKKPERAEVLSDWMKSNPLPNIKDSVGAEPAVAFLKTAESEEEIKVWINTECKVKHEDVACIALYEWIKISNAWSDKVTKTYREPLLTKLHEKKEFQRAEATKIEGLVIEIVISN
jgi:hypothetical protein